MSSLKYVGSSVSPDALIPKIETDPLITSTLTMAQVDERVDAQIPDFLNQSDIDQMIAGKITENDINIAKQEYVRSTDVDVSNGAVVLDANGKVPAFRYQTNDTSRGWKWMGTVPTWSPGWCSVAGDQITTWNISSPGYRWFPLFVGFAAFTGQKGEVLVVQGTSYISRAIGGNSPQGKCCPFMPVSFTTFTGSATFTVRRRSYFDGAFAYLEPTYSLGCFAVPA